VLSGYIARMKKEKQERLAHDSHLTNGYPNDGAGHPRSPFRSNAGAGYPGAYGSYQHPAVGPHRGGYSYSRGAPPAYHPYQRPAQKFRNKSVTFQNQDLGREMSADKRAVGLTTNSTPAPGVQHTESQTLCPAFTLTGKTCDDRPWQFFFPVQV
jgi:hypothetical protein